MADAPKDDAPKNGARRPAAKGPRRTSGPDFKTRLKDSMAPVTAVGSISSPVLHRKVRINSSYAIYILGNVLGDLRGALERLHQEEFRFGREQTGRAALFAAFDTRLNYLEAEIKKRTAWADKFLEEHDDEDLDCTYTLPQEAVIDITTPQIGQFLRILIEFDQVCQKMEPQWLTGKITSDEIKTELSKSRDLIAKTGRYMANAANTAANSAMRERQKARALAARDDGSKAADAVEAGQKSSEAAENDAPPADASAQQAEPADEAAAPRRKKKAAADTPAEAAPVAL